MANFQSLILMSALMSEHRWGTPDWGRKKITGGDIFDIITGLIRQRFLLQVSLYDT